MTLKRQQDAKTLSKGFDLPLAHTARVARNVSALDSAVLGKGLLQMLLGKLEDEVADKGRVGSYAGTWLAGTAQKSKRVHQH